MTDTLLFTISIDTEIDKSPNWDISPQHSFRSVLEGIPETLSPLFARHDAHPTYLLSGEVMEDDASVEVLREQSDSELGTHLHGEMVGPGRKSIDSCSGRTAEMQCSYPPEVEMRKLEDLTELFVRKFGYRPLSFRAGRFGAGKGTIGCLERLGYRVDTSVTPSHRWCYPEGEVDFSIAPDQPYFPCPTDLNSQGTSSVLEVPVTIVPHLLRQTFCSSELVSRSAILRRATDLAFPTVWVRPSHTSTERMIKAIDRMRRRYERKEVVVVNMMFHSMEVIPLASPVCATEQEVLALKARIDGVLGHCRRNGFRFVVLSDVVRYFLHEARYQV